MSSSRLPARRDDLSPVVDATKASPMMLHGIARLTEIESEPLGFKRMSGYGDSLFLWNGWYSHSSWDEIRVRTLTKSTWQGVHLFEFSADGVFRRTIEVSFTDVGEVRLVVEDVIVRRDQIVVKGLFQSNGRVYDGPNTLTPFLFFFTRDGERLKSLIEPIEDGWGEIWDAERAAILAAPGIEQSLNGEVEVLAVADDGLWVTDGSQLHGVSFEFRPTVESLTLDRSSREAGFNRMHTPEAHFGQFSIASDPWRFYVCYDENGDLHLEVMSHEQGIESSTLIQTSGSLDLGLGFRIIEVPESVQRLFPSGRKERRSYDFWMSAWGNVVCFFIPTSTNDSWIVTPYWHESMVARNGSFRLSFEDCIVVRPCFVMDDRIYSLGLEEHTNQRGYSASLVFVHDLEGNSVNWFQTRMPKSVATLYGLS